MDIYKARPWAAKANWLANNIKWIQRQIASGRRIFDIGEDASRKPSQYYKAEIAQLIKAGFTKVYRGTITVGDKTYAVYEWVRR